MQARWRARNDDRLGALLEFRTLCVRPSRISVPNLLDPTSLHFATRRCDLRDVAQVRSPRLTRALRKSIEHRVDIREQEEVIELQGTRFR